MKKGDYVLIENGKIGRIRDIQKGIALVEITKPKRTDTKSAEQPTPLEIVTVSITLLQLLSELIPIAETLWGEIKRLWLLLFGSAEQKAAIRAYNALQNSKR